MSGLTSAEASWIAQRLLSHGGRLAKRLTAAREKHRHPQLIDELSRDLRESSRLAEKLMKIAEETQ